MKTKFIAVEGPGGFDSLALGSKEIPEPEEGMIQVRWHATSLNYHDYLVANGSIPVEAGRIPMSDGAGEVIAVGDGVETWRSGDRIMSLFFPKWLEGRPTGQKCAEISGENVDGYMAEVSNIAAFACTRIPDTLSYAEAACMPCAGLTAWRGLMEECYLAKGDKVLVEGTGGVSIFALQIAKAQDAVVFATTSQNAKAARLTDLGAAHVVNYKEDERWGKSIYKLAGGGVDQVIDVGGGSTFRHSVDAVAMDGRITSIGILDGRSGSLQFPKLFFKHIHIDGIAVGSRAMQRNMSDYFEKNEIRPIIDEKRFSFDQLKEAFQYQESGQHFGKIVLEW